MPLVFILVVAVGLANFFYLLPPVINWDEGTHALWGFKEWLALRSGDFSLFWELSRAQFAYPPLGSWLIAFINLPFEFSMNLARFSSTIGFIVGGVLLWMVAKDINKSHKTNWTNWIALFLFLTSPAILFYSVTVFKESWGMALTLLTFYLYFMALEKKKIIYYLLTGLILTGLFFEKYNYALLLVLVLGIEAVVELVLRTAGPVGRLLGRSFLRRQKTTPQKLANFGVRHPLLISQLALFLPLFLFGIFWILTPTNKSQWFLDIMRSDWNPVTVGIGNSWQYLTFFVQSIRVSYVFSDVLFWLLVVGYVGAVRDLWRKKIRVLWLFFTINFILGTLHSINLQDRYILTSVPALFLIVGYELNKIFNFQFSIFKSTLSVLLILLVLLDLRNFPQLLKSNATHMLLSPMYNESDYKDTLFDFNKSHWPGNIEVQRKTETQKGNIFVSQKDSAFLRYQESPEGVIDYILDNVDITKPIEIIGATAEISLDWVELRRQLKKQNYKIYNNYNDYKNYIVTLEVKPASRLYTYDYRRANAWQLGKVREVEEMWGDKLLKEKDFRELGIVVRIYAWKN